MTTQSSQPLRPRPGPKARWGERSYASIGWPVEHREKYEQLARERGMSLNEYVIRFMAASHDLIDPSAVEGDSQLPLGA